MPRIAYTVTATLPDEPTMRKYAAWLSDGHLQDVLNAGAASAQLVILDADPTDPPHRVQSDYIFHSRESFDSYTNEKAPALRAQGLALFGPDSGVTFSRTVGSILD